MKNESSDIHPELQQFAKFFPNLTFSRKNLWLVNLLPRLLPAPARPKGIRIQNVLIPGSEDQKSIRLRIYRPTAMDGRTIPALLWFHGGGYVSGRPEQDEQRCMQYALELNITVVSVDYRLAPKDPFPAALEDGYTALKWAAAHTSIDNQRIAIGGASAGAGLAAALIHLAHDRREIQPIFQLLVYPMLDDRTVLRPDADDSQNITWNQNSNRFGWESYLAKKCGQEDLPEYAVPARRENLAGLPAAWIGVGTLDLFYDEDKTYARRLQAAGVPCEFCEVPGGFHAFDVFLNQIPVVQEFRKSQIAALKKCFFADGIYFDATNPAPAASR